MTQASERPAPIQLEIQHFASKEQVERLSASFAPGEPFIHLMLQFALSNRELQQLRDRQEQKRLDRIAASILPGGWK